MIAGLNLRATIWQISQSTDDSAGGAVATGTTVHTNVPIRIQQQAEELLLLQQGLQTPKIWTALIAPVNLDIEERYEIEITKPQTHYLYGIRLRVMNVRQSDFASNKQGYIILTLARSVKSHGRA